MARSNVIADIFQIARRIPWWISICIAGVLYFSVPLLLKFAYPTATDPVFQAVYSGGETFIILVLQHLFPLAFLLGAVASFYDQLFSGSLLKQIRAVSSEHDHFANVSWRHFEKLTAAYFRERGFYVFETQEGTDGGVDLKMLKGGQVFYVQCKHWRARKVPVQKVRELFGVMAANGATGGFIVASGKFTLDAKRFAAGKNIRLISGNEIVQAPSELETELDVLSHLNSDKTALSGNSVADPANTQPAPSIVCPACKNTMVLRTARRGVNAGRQFYGCSSYPRCKAIVNLHEQPIRPSFGPCSELNKRH